MDQRLRCLDCEKSETCETIAWLVEDFEDLAELEMMVRLKCPEITKLRKAFMSGCQSGELVGQNQGGSFQSDSAFFEQQFDEFLEYLFKEENNETD